jgi:hypothetical protein
VKQKVWHLGIGRLQHKARGRTPNLHAAKLLRFVTIAAVNQLTTMVRRPALFGAVPAALLVSAAALPFLGSTKWWIQDLGLCRRCKSQEKVWPLSRPPSSCLQLSSTADLESALTVALLRRIKIALRGAAYTLFFRTAN